MNGDVYELEKKLDKLRYDLVENILPDDASKRKAKVVLDIATLKSSTYPVIFFWGCVSSELLRRCEAENDVATVEKIIGIIRSLEKDQICLANLSRMKTYRSFKLEPRIDVDMGKIHREGKRYEHLKIPTEISDGLYKLHESGGSKEILGYAAGCWRIMLHTFKDEFERHSHENTYR
jgi:hypothetical protein